jgi:hypothetical protein
MRGRGIAPAPVACATFAGGETIRMVFFQPVNKPWRVDDVRAWLEQIIGNERGRTQGGRFASELADLKRKLDAANALKARPGTEGEGKAVGRAVRQLSATMKKLQADAMGAVFNSLSAFTRVYEPATDITEFYIEHDGQRIDLKAIDSPVKKLSQARRARKLVPARITSIEPEKPAITSTMLIRELETQLGTDFLQTVGWRRVCARLNKKRAA